MEKFLKIIASYMIVCTLISSCGLAAFKTSPIPQKTNINENNIDSLMVDKFVFLYSVLNIGTEPVIDLTTVLNRSELEIRFMEELTGIQCSYPADRLGRHFIYEKDYIEWTAWYFKNQRYLVWDDALNKILVIKH